MGTFGNLFALFMMAAGLTALVYGSPFAGLCLIAAGILIHTFVRHRVIYIPRWIALPSALLLFAFGLGSLPA